MITSQPSAPDRQQEHRYVWELLPWFVNRTLDAHEHARVEAHLLACLICRAEVNQLRRLEREVRDDVAISDALERGLAATSRRLDALATVPERGGRSRIGGFRGGVIAGLRSSHPGIKALLAAQAAALLVVITLPALNRVSEPAGEGAEYRTLTDAAPQTTTDAAAMMRIKFHDDVGERVMRQTLLEHNLRIIDGPSPTGLYTIVSMVQPGDAAVRQQMLQRLSGAPAVALVVSASTLLPVP